MGNEINRPVDLLAPNGMEIEVVEESGGPDIAIIGDVDLSCSIWLGLGCVAEGFVRTVLLVVVKMAGATTIDSSGIASLLKVYQIAKKRGGLMILASCGELTMIVLALAKMDEVFNLAVNVDAGR